MTEVRNGPAAVLLLALTTSALPTLFALAGVGAIRVGWNLLGGSRKRERRVHDPSAL
jgi:hypothetical protein